MKHFFQWQNSAKPLNSFLRRGDLIDKAFVNYFVIRLNAQIFDGGIAQVIMPGDDKNGLFPTIKCSDGVWTYCGDCKYGREA